MTTATLTVASSAQDIYTVTIDYRLDPPELVTGLIEAGKYDLINPQLIGDMMHKFPFKGAGRVRTRLQLFGLEEISNLDQAKKQALLLGFAPANLPEILAFGQAHPNEQLKQPIITLGAIWNHFRCVACPCLDGQGKKRRLTLYWLHDLIDTECRVLGVLDRKVLTT